MDIGLAPLLLEVLLRPALADVAHGHDAREDEKHAPSNRAELDRDRVRRPALSTVTLGLDVARRALEVKLVKPVPSSHARLSALIGIAFWKYIHFDRNHQNFLQNNRAMLF